jgi:uncharacterized protein
MKSKRTAISAAIVLLSGLAAWAQDKPWGKREKPAADSEVARIEALTCPVCSATVERVNITSSAVQDYELDTDFKVVKANFNVYPYVLATCPKCSFSTYSMQFHKELGAEARKAVQMALEKDKQEFADAWTVPMSHTLKAAVLTHRALKSGEGTLYEIFVLGSYLARDAGEASAEREMQRRAVENLVQAIERDEGYQRPKMRYMVAELQRRLGHFQEAMDWFAQARTGAEEYLQKLISRQELATREAMDKKKAPK